MKTIFLVSAAVTGLVWYGWSQSARVGGPGESGMGVENGGQYNAVSANTNAGGRTSINDRPDGGMGNNGPTNGVNSWNTAGNHLNTVITNWSKGPTNYSGNVIPGANPGPPNGNSPGSTGPQSF